jgi:hypothetical protein
VLTGATTDVDDEERLVLASFDTLAAMATTDEAKLRELLTDPPYDVRVMPRSNNAIAAGMAPSYDES